MKHCSSRSNQITLKRRTRPFKFNSIRKNFFSRLLFSHCPGGRRSRKLHPAQEPDTVHHPPGQAERLPCHICLLHQVGSQSPGKYSAPLLPSDLCQVTDSRPPVGIPFFLPRATSVYRTLFPTRLLPRSLSLSPHSISPLLSTLLKGL